MDCINIKKKVVLTEQGNKSYYYVSALSLKNSNNEVKLLVPHPNGNAVMEFCTLSEAVSAIKKSGFKYKLPEGEAIADETIEALTEDSRKSDLETLLFDKFKSKTNDINPSIVASAITALAYLNTTDAIDIFIDKLGEDNEKIRTSAIEALINSQSVVVDKLIDTLTNPNWVSRNSAITCLTKISELGDLELEKIIVPMINRIEDENPIVQANAIVSIGKIYSNLKKN